MRVLSLKRIVGSGLFVGSGLAAALAGLLFLGPMLGFSDWSREGPGPRSAGAVALPAAPAAPAGTTGTADPRTDRALPSFVTTLARGDVAPATVLASRPAPVAPTRARARAPRRQPGPRSGAPTPVAPAAPVATPAPPVPVPTPAVPAAEPEPEPAPVAEPAARPMPPAPPKQQHFSADSSEGGESDRKPGKSRDKALGHEKKTDDGPPAPGSSSESAAGAGSGEPDPQDSGEEQDEDSTDQDHGRPRKKPDGD